MAAMVNMLLSWSYFIQHDMQYFSTGQKLFEYISKKFAAKETRTKITEDILSNQILCTFIERIIPIQYGLNQNFIEIYFVEIEDGTG